MRSVILREFQRATTCVAALTVLLLVAGTAHAHGGYYQGPKTPDGVPLPTHTPGTGTPLPGGGPITPPTSGPAVTGRKGGSDLPPAVTPSTQPLPPSLTDPPLAGTAWEFWWSVHRARLVQMDRNVSPLDITPRSRGADDDSNVDALDTVLPLLVELLADSSQDVRASAALGLGRAADERGVEALRGAASDDESTDVRQAAIVALGLSGSTGEIPFLHAVLIDEDELLRTRCLAVLAMGMIGGPEAAELITTTLRPASREAGRAPETLVASGLVALGLTDADEAIEPLRGALGNTKLREIVRAYAITSLARLGDHESLDQFATLLVESNDAVTRQSAAIAVGRLATLEDVKPINSLLHAARNDRDQGAQNLAVVAVAEIKGEPVRKQLEDLFARSSDTDRPFRALALGVQADLAAAPLLREAYPNAKHEESLQASIVLALGLMGDVEGVPFLEEEVGRKKRFWSPGYAALALAMIGARGSADVINARLEISTDPRQVANLAVPLGMLGDPRATARLKKMLLQKDSVLEACIGAVALGAIGADNAAEELLAVAQAGGERPELVRACAVSALGRLLDEREVPRLAEVLADHDHHVELSPLVHLRSLLLHR